MPGTLNFQDVLGRTPMPGSTAEIFQGLLFQVLDVNEHTAVIRDTLRTFVLTVLSTAEIREMEPTWIRKFGPYHLIPQYPTPPGFTRATPVKYIFPHPVLGNTEELLRVKRQRIEKAQKKRFALTMAELRAIPGIGSDYFAAMDRFYNL